MPVRLPLFPLGSVLVPGLVLPLHIFEQRYRVLIQALLALPDDAERQFGVVAIRSGSEAETPDPAQTPLGPQTGLPPPSLPPRTYTVGCTAELREVTPYSDGRFDIVAVGENRFRLVGIDDDAGTPYQTGLVEFLPEPEGTEDGAVEPAELDHLRRNVVAQFADYRRRLQVDVTELPDDPRVISYLVTAAMVLDLPDRQRLLEEPSTAARLQAEIDLLRRERTLVTAFEALPAVDLARGASSPN